MAAVRLLLAAVLLVSGCTAPAPTPSPSPPAPQAIVGLPRGCLGVGEPDCERVASAAVAMLSGRQPVWVDVAHAGCPGEAPCPPEIAPGAGARATVHFADAGEPVSIRFVNDDAALVPEVQREVFAQARAASGPAPRGAPFPFSLQHCGLVSPIDADGSLWVPVGFVDASHADAINQAAGTLTLVAADEARLRTAGGLDVRLARFGATLWVRPCD